MKKMNGKQEVILIELDDHTLKKRLDEVEKWFEHILTLQFSLEKVLEKAIPKIKEPHIKEAMEKVQEANKFHTESAQNLFHIINRKCNTTRDQATALVMGKLEESIVKTQDVFGGAFGSWQDIHLLLLVNEQTRGAFGVAEQLGLSLGIKEIVKAAFSITHEKTIHQLLIQEYMLEMAPISILYKEDA